MTWIITPIKVKAQDAEAFRSNVPVMTMTDSKEVSDYVRDAACRAFPEYASKIRANQVPSTLATQNQSMRKPDIVIQETRAISDNENVMYTEYSNGITMLSGTYTVGKNITNTQGSEPAYTYTFNAWLQILGSYDTMLIENIILGIAPDYSHFASFGRVSPASSTNSATRTGYRQTGRLGSLDSAYVEYYGAFNISFSLSGGELNYLQYATMKIYADNNRQIAFACY